MITPVPPGVTRAVRFLINEIEEGRYVVGSRMPGLGALASKAGVSINTMRKVTSFLKDKGILEGVRGQHSRVISAQVEYLKQPLEDSGTGTDSPKSPRALWKRTAAAIK
ncbi:MAG: GntR family transcriptional regulator, partial [Chitinivibrionales bacterium]|nr:GntR family transcriptional regulator [Chitinivibrionales bacterium]